MTAFSTGVTFAPVPIEAVAFARPYMHASGINLESEPAEANAQDGVTPCPKGQKQQFPDGVKDVRHCLSLVGAPAARRES